MRVVARQELRDLWLGGRGMVLLLAFSVLVSAITYVGATSEGINFLEKRETVNLTLQVAIAFGALVALCAIGFTLTGNIFGVFFLLPVALVVWFVFIRPTHQKRYRAAIQNLPVWSLRAE